MDSFTAAQSPLGLDRVLVADRVFAARRAGQTEAEVATAFGLSRGQIRRMVRTFGRVRRDQMVRL